MDYFEKNLLESLNLQRLMWFRYIDNFFHLHTLEEGIKKFLRGLNEFDENLKLRHVFSKEIVSFFRCRYKVFG